VVVAVPVVWDNDDGGDARQEEGRRPLLLGTPSYQRWESEQLVRRRMISRLQYLSLAFGAFVGFFVESGALAAHVLYQGEHRAAAAANATSALPATTQIVAFSLTWATATALLPCVAMFFLRSILVVVANRLMTHSMSFEGHRERVEAARRVGLQDCLWHLESRFGLGSFFGVSLSATIMDLWLGVRRHVVLTAALLATVTLCFFVLSRQYHMHEAERQDCFFVDDDDEDNSVVVDERESGYEEEAKIAYPSLGRKLDSVDPEAMDAIELKHGSCVLVV